MQFTNCKKVSAADCPASGKSACRSRMGFPGMGSKPDSDTGRSQQETQTGNHGKTDGAGYRPTKKGGLTMTRVELEKELVKKMWEIQALIDEFDSTVNITSIACSKDYVNAFAFTYNENNEPEEYIFNAEERLEG